MALTQEDLDALEKAMATGTRRVTIDGRTVEYRDMAEMERAHARISRALGKSERSQTRYGSFSKGL